MMRVLRGIFEPRGVKVPAPLQARRSPRHVHQFRTLAADSFAPAPLLALRSPLLVPWAVQVMTTRWGADPFARGSYSSMPVSPPFN